ncbi:aminotransferase class I/II-fold pyridoxal phosphate-dependent enzyme [Mesorhizobium sp. M0090]
MVRPVKLSLQNARRKASEDILRSAVGDRTRAILLNSPNNPGGYVFGKEDLETIATFAERHNLWIISDEVYRSTVFDGEFLSIAFSPGMRERTIIVNSLSKSHNDRLEARVDAWAGLGISSSGKSCAMHALRIADRIQDAAAVTLDEAGDEEMRFFSDALLPLMLTNAVRMFAGDMREPYRPLRRSICLGFLEPFRTFSLRLRSSCACSCGALRCLDPQWRGHYATISLVEICPQRTGTTLGHVS